MIISPIKITLQFCKMQILSQCNFYSIRIPTFTFIHKSDENSYFAVAVIQIKESYASISMTIGLCLFGVLPCGVRFHFRRRPWMIWGFLRRHNFLLKKKCCFFLLSVLCFHSILLRLIHLKLKGLISSAWLRTTHIATTYVCGHTQMTFSSSTCLQSRAGVYIQLRARGRTKNAMAPSRY